MLLLTALTALTLSAFAAPDASVAIVPGCPAAEDGGLSHCQQRRLAWVMRLWNAEKIDYVITSGAAVYNPFVEADVMAEALVASGIPADRVLRERNALHTDQNISWSLAIAEQHGFGHIVVATDLGQAQHGCAMIRAWTETRCTPEAVDYRRVREDLIAGALHLPDLRVSPVADWLPLEEREARIASATGTAVRASSFKVYLENALGGMDAPRPVLPPPTLRTASAQ